MRIKGKVLSINGIFMDYQVGNTIRSLQFKNAAIGDYLVANNCIGGIFEVNGPLLNPTKATWKITNTRGIVLDFTNLIREYAND